MGKINKLGLEKFKLEEQEKALKGQAGNEQQLAAIKQQLTNIQADITKTQGEIDRTYGIVSMPKSYKTAFGVSTGAGIAGESFYYMDGSKSLSNPVDVLGSVYNVGVNAAYDSAFYTANPLQSLGLDTLKGIGKDGKGVSESFNDSGKSNSFSMVVDSVGKKFGMNQQQNLYHLFLIIL